MKNHPVTLLAAALSFAASAAALPAFAQIASRSGAKPLAVQAQPSRRGLTTRISFHSLPAEVLVKRLSLTPDQTKRIARVQAEFTTRREAAFRELREATKAASKADEADPARDRVRAAFQELSLLSRDSDRAFVGALTPDQTERLGPLLDEGSLFHELRLPLGSLADVRPNETEWAELLAVWNDVRWRDPVRMIRAHRGSVEDRKAMEEEERQKPAEAFRKALAVLAPANRKALEAYVKAHPEADPTMPKTSTQRLLAQGA